MRLYRGMKADADGLPTTQGNPKMALSVKIGDGEYDDIPEEEGFVKPGTGGLSVTHDDPHKLPAHRLPPSYGGSAKGNVVFFIEHAELGAELLAVYDPIEDDDSHYCVQPAQRCAVEVYLLNLANTRTNWNRHELA